MQDYKYLLERQIGESIEEPVKVEKRSKKIFVKILYLLLFLAIISGGIAGYFYVKKSKVFEIKKFQIIGIENSSKKEIQKILNKNKDKSLEEIYLKLIKVKWVDDVILKKKFPDLLEVKIIEKKPESILERDGTLYLIDKDGKIIDKYSSKYYRRDFVIFNFPHLKKYGKNEQKKVAEILEILKNYPFREDISDISINGNDLKIILTSPRMEVKISLENLKDEIYKIRILQQLANSEYVKKSAIADLNYKDRIYLTRSK